MSVIGLICAFNEEENIAAAVGSMLDAGCDRVTVVDGAWRNPDGSWFGGAPFPESSDRTVAQAADAGATVIFAPEDHLGSDGAKRNWAIHSCDASTGDHLLLLDADEHLIGRVDAAVCPSSHGCVIHRDLDGNDLPGLGGVWPHGDYGPEKPLLRWLRYSGYIHCDSPGVYFDGAPEPPLRIHAYLVGALGEHPLLESEPLFAHAHRLIREHEASLTPAEASVLPICPGFEIHHLARPSAERVEAKRRYYAPEGVLA